jgi:hypothetical protein
MRKCNLVESKCKGCLLFSVQQILTSLKVKFWADSMNRLVKKFTAVPGEVKGVNEWQVPWVELAIMSSSKMTALVGELYKVTTLLHDWNLRLEFVMKKASHTARKKTEQQRGSIGQCLKQPEAHCTQKSYHYAYGRKP